MVSDGVKRPVPLITQFVIGQLAFLLSSFELYFLSMELISTKYRQQESKFAAIDSKFILNVDASEVLLIVALIISA